MQIIEGNLIAHDARIAIVVSSLTVKKLAQSKKFDAIVALGCVIRGATYHFEIVANESAKGLTQVMLENNIPVAFGILTTDNIDQAVQRAGSKETKVRKPP